MTQVGCTRLTGIGRRGAVAFKTSAGFRKYNCATVSPPVRKRSARMFAAALRASRGALTQGGTPGSFSGNVLFNWDAGWQDCSLPIQGYDDDYGQGSGLMEASVNGHVLGTFYTTQPYYAQLWMTAGCADLEIWAEEEEGGGGGPSNPYIEIGCNYTASELTVTRGTNVDCVAQAEPTGELTNITWSFEGDHVGNLWNLGSSASISGTVVDGGTVHVSGEVDDVPVDDATLRINVNARTTGFAYGTHVDGGQTSTLGCKDYWSSDAWGWTVLPGTCDMHVFMPAAFGGGATGGATISQGSGLNAGAYYVLSFSNHIETVSGVIPDLLGSGRPSYTVGTLANETSLVSPCATSGSTTSSTLFAMDSCMSSHTSGLGLNLTGLSSQLQAHEGCHRSKDILNKFAGRAATLHSEVEAKVGIANLAADVLLMIQHADDDIKWTTSGQIDYGTSPNYIGPTTSTGSWLVDNRTDIASC